VPGKKAPEKKAPSVKKKKDKERKPSETTLSKEELRDLARDIVKNEDINLFFRNAVGDNEWAGKKLFEKMERMLDLGTTLDNMTKQQRATADSWRQGFAGCCLVQGR